MSYKVLINKISATRKGQFWIFFAILIVVSLLVSYCLDPISRGVDFHFHYRRFTSLINALRDDNIISYLDYNAVAGYGYMSNTFYPDVTLIPFALLGLITGPLFAYKFTLFAMSILCGYFTYRTVDIIFKSPLAGYVAGILYTFCNYRLFDIFHRSSLGEIITFTFVPIVILGLYYIINGNYKKWYIITIGFTFIVFSHAISSLLMFITVVIILLFNIQKLIREPKRILYLVIAGIATLFITSYYLFPMIEQMQSDTFYYSTPWQTAEKNQLSWYWIICGMTTGPNYPNLFEPPKLGLLLTLVIGLRLFVRSKKELLKMADRYVIVGFILLFITSSFFPWSVFPFNKLGFIQFPWRLFEFISFFFAAAGGYYLSQTKLSKRYFAIFCIIFLGYTCFLIINDSKVYNAMEFKHLHSLEPSLENHYLGSGREYLPINVKAVKELYERGDYIDSKTNTSKITDIERNRGILSFEISASGKDTIELPLIYYKGYSVSLEGKNISIEQSKNGLIQTIVDQSGRVEAYYKGTITQLISFIVSVIGILTLCIYIYAVKRRKKNTLTTLQ